MAETESAITKTQKERPSPRRKRKWLRRLILLGAVAVVLVSIVAALLPTVLTSRFVESRAEAKLTELVGRPVRIGDLRFGWRTPFSFEELRIEGLQDEENAPLFVLRGVSVPLSLFSLAKGPPYRIDPVQVDFLEVNAVRTEGGEWNALRVMESVQRTLPKKEEEKTEEPFELGSLPIDGLKIHAGEIAVRLIDHENGMTAGWEDGSLDVLWDGGTNPLTIDVAGKARVDERTMPWDVRFKLTDWIDEELRPTPLQMHLTGGSDGLMHAGQIGEGGFFIEATSVAGEDNVLRVVVPLQPLSSLAGGGHPPIDGQVDLTVLARTDAERNGIEFSGTLESAGVDIPAEWSGGVAIAPPDIEADWHGEVSLQDKALRSLRAGLKVSPLSASLELTEWPFDAPMTFGSVLVESRIDFAPAFELAAAFADDLPNAMADGSASLRAVGKGTAGEGMTFTVETEFEPGTLRPLYEDREAPDWLPSAPLDLSFLAFESRTVLSVDGGFSQLFIDSVSAEGEAFELNGKASAGLTDPLAQWEVDLSARCWVPDALDLARLPNVPPQLTRLDAMASLTTTAKALSPTRFATSGEFALTDAAFNWSDPPVDITEPETTAAWDLSIEREPLEVTINSAEMKNSFFQLEASGSWAGEADLSGAGALDLGRLDEIARPVLPEGTMLGGTIGGEFRCSGAPGDRVEIQASALTEEPLVYRQPGMVQFESPVECESQAALVWRDQNLEAIEFAVPGAALGESAMAALEGRVGLGDGTGLRMDGQAEALHAPLLGFIDPAFWRPFDFALNSGGQTSLEFSVSAPFSVSGEGMDFGEEWTVSGEAQTEAEALEWVRPEAEMAQAIQSVTDQRRFIVRIPPEDPMAFVYTDEAETAFAQSFGPMDLELESVQAATRTRFEMNKPIGIAVPEGMIGGLVFPRDAFDLQMPEMAFTTDLVIDMEKSLFEARDAEFSAPEMGEGQASFDFNWGDMRWSTQADVLVNQLSGAARTIAFKDGSTMPIPELLGEAVVTVDLRGQVTDEEFSAASGLPMEGLLITEFRNVGTVPSQTLLMENLGGSTSMEIAPGGKTLSIASDHAIERITNQRSTTQPLENIRWKSTFELRDMDAIDAALEEFSVGNYETRLGASFSMQGLAEALSDQPETLGGWLRALPMRADFQFDQQMAGLKGVSEFLDSSGHLEAGGSLVNTPGSRMQANGSLVFDAVAIAMEPFFDLEGLDGDWSLVKTIRHGESSRGIGPPPESEIRLDQMVIHSPFGRENVEGAVMRIRGLDQGLQADCEVPRLLGGSLSSDWSLGMRDGDPVLSGRLESTGVDMSLLARANRRGGQDTSLSGLGTFEWSLSPGAGSSLFEDLSLSFEATHIGKRALSALLQAMDPEQSDPRFQNALAALQFGTPSGGEFRLEDGLITAGSRLALPLGVSVPLPILDRQPLGDLMAVYNLGEKAQMVEMMRWGLLVLLASDLDELDAVLSSIPSVTGGYE